jgi:hypothetical protein
LSVGLRRGCCLSIGTGLLAAAALMQHHSLYAAARRVRQLPSLVKTLTLRPTLQRAGGNTAFALLTAVGANIAALATLPLLAGPLLGGLLPGRAPQFGHGREGP